MFAAIQTVFTSFFSIFSFLFSAAARYAKLADDISKNHASDIKAEHQLNTIKRKAAIDKASKKVGRLNPFEVREVSKLKKVGANELVRS